MTADSLTLASIGQELGVTPAAIYRYFPDRAAVLDALAQEVLEDLSLPAEGVTWREWLWSSAQTQRALWRGHPELHAAQARGALRAPGERILAAGVRVLTRAGFPEAPATAGVLAVMHLACSFGISESAAESGPAVDDVDPARADSDFARMLDLVLDGLASQVHTPRRWGRKP